MGLNKSLGSGVLVLGINHICKWVQIVSGGKRYTCPMKEVNGELFFHFKKGWHSVLAFAAEKMHELK